jgi:phosphoribosylformylglycinamidine (FGAM) synthase PurS component
MTTHRIILTVGLKVTDNEARSALEALQEKMGLRGRVRDLAREEMWEIGVEADSPEAAVDVVTELVLSTNLFANPNKHTYTMRAADDAGSGRSDAGDSGTRGEEGAGGGSRAAAGSAADLSPDEIAILVSDRGCAEGESVLSAIRRIGVDRVGSVRRWTKWRVRLADPPRRGDSEVDSLIRAIGVTTGRREGLLSNPHSQTSLAVLPWGEEKRLAA